MRILFINTVDTSGGAAVIMQRLMKGLSGQYGTDNRLLVRNKKGNATNTIQLLHAPIPTVAEKIVDRITRKTGLLYQYFPFTSRAIIRNALEFRPDVINLHNTHGGYFATPLLKELSAVAPVVWTLHDMWSFAGNASHTMGNMSWKYLRNDPELARIPPSIGINTGAWLLRQKKRIYQASRLTLVTPSKWLEGLALQSPVFQNNDIHQIYNGIDPAIYKPLDKPAAKRKLGIPEGQRTILFSSHFLQKDHPFKGGRDLIEILRKINGYTDTTICFLALGGGQIDELQSLTNLNIQYKGYVESESEMVDCLNAADLFIYPTRADNLPNVLVESIACGTPAITFDIGGNKEIISHNYNGMIIPPFDYDAFARCALVLLEDPQKTGEFSRNGLQRVQQLFLEKTMTDRYYQLFKETIENQR